MPNSPIPHGPMRLGAMVQLDKDNSTHNTSIGNWLVITKVEEEGRKANASVYASKEAALKMAGIARGELDNGELGGENHPGPSVALLHGVTKATFSNMLSTPELIETILDKPSPYDGKQVAMVLPVYKEGVFAGAANVDATISHDTDTNEFYFVFSHDGEEQRVATTEASVRKELNLDRRQIEAFPVKLNVNIVGKELVAALKHFDGSKSIADNSTVCAKELKELLVATNIISDGLIGHESTEDRATLAGLGAAFKKLMSELIIEDFASPTAVGQRIFEASKTPPAKTPPPRRQPQQPNSQQQSSQQSQSQQQQQQSQQQQQQSSTLPAHVESISQQCALVRHMAMLAKDAESWSTFLVWSVNATCKEEQRNDAKEMPKVQVGALERKLRDWSSAQDIKTLAVEASLDAKQLQQELLYMQMEFEHAQHANGPKEPTENSQKQGQSQGGVSIWSEHVQVRSTSDESENRERQTLRGDIEHVMTGNGIKELIALNSLREKGSTLDEIAGACAKITDPNLTRLIGSKGDIASALHGMRDPRPLNMITNLRSALERRLERHLHEDSAVLSDRYTKALRHLRTGNLQSLRLLHLIDKDDCGTAEEPLKQLTKNGASAEASLTLALNHMQAVISLAHPHLGGKAILFFGKLTARISYLRTRPPEYETSLPRAEWPAISTWLAKVFSKVARPQRQYCFGELSSGGYNFDLSLITGPSEYNEELTNHLVAQGHKMRTKDDGASSSKGADKRLKEAEKRASVAEKKLSEERKRKSTKPSEEPDDGDDEAPEPKSKRPKAGSPEMKEWNENNKIKGKPRCWDDGNGGCKRGAKCKFPHKKE